MSYSAFTMNGNAVIKACHASANGGGLHITGANVANPLTFIINDNAVIGGDSTVDGNTANYGGGVSAGGTIPTINIKGSDGQFPKIKNNTAVYNGGGVFMNGTTPSFTMSGGEISGNTSSSNGGVFTFGTLTMSGGKITRNWSPRGGGIYSSAAINISAGEISYNKATTAKGVTGVVGGIYAVNVNMTGGKINNNEAQAAGGIWGPGSSVIMIGGTTVISNNMVWGWCGCS